MFRRIFHRGIYHPCTTGVPVGTAAWEYPIYESRTNVNWWSHVIVFSKACGTPLSKHNLSYVKQQENVNISTRHENTIFRIPQVISFTTFSQRMTRTNSFFLYLIIIYNYIVIGLWINVLKFFLKDTRRDLLSSKSESADLFLFK